MSFALAKSGLHLNRAFAQGTGRDQHVKGFSLILGGGAVQWGKSYGTTNEFG